MNTSSVAAMQSQIEASLRPLTDTQQAMHMRAYTLGKFAFLGIKATPRRQALRSLPRLKTWSAAELLALTESLWDLPEREFQYVAVDLLAKHHAQLGPKSLPRLLKLVQCHSWWDTVDGLAGVVGDILLQARTGECDVQRHMDVCLIHSNLWVRRVAMLHQLGWKAETDQARLLHYALTLAPETDFFIRKAIGWALRNYTRTEPETIRAFLSKHALLLSGLTRREAAKHLG